MVESTKIVRMVPWLAIGESYQIRTTRAVYSRARVLHVDGPDVIVQYLRQTRRRRPIRVNELIRRSSILRARRYTV